MNTLILLVAMSMTGLMAGRLEACYKPQSLLPEKLLPKLGTVGCIVQPKPFFHFKKTAVHLFAEEQDDGFCLYRKVQSLGPSMRPLFKLPNRFSKSMNADRSSGEFSHQRPVPEKTTKRKFWVSYEVTSIETVEKLKSRGKQVAGKSVSIDDVAVALEEEFADSAEAQYASGVASYVLSGKAAITATGPSFCFATTTGLNCKALQQSSKSVLLKRIVDTIIETAETSDDSTSCAKQSQI